MNKGDLIRQIYCGHLDDIVFKYEKCKNKSDMLKCLIELRPNNKNLNDELKEEFFLTDDDDLKAVRKIFVLNYSRLHCLLKMHSKYY